MASSPCRGCVRYTKTCRACQEVNRKRYEKRCHKRMLKATRPLRRANGLIRARSSEIKAPGTHTAIKAGYVYCVTNPAWPGLAKIGSAIDLQQRLGTFQTGDPHRGYVLEVSEIVGDRVAVERQLHLRFSSKRVNGEWFLVSPVEVERELHLLL